MAAKPDNLTPDGYESPFDKRETEKIDNFIIGAPGPETLRRATQIFSEATTHRMEHASQDTPSGNGTIFQYGPRTGYMPFKLQLAKFLNDEYCDEAVPVQEDNLVLTAGATVGLWLAATCLLPAGRGVVFIECPSYFIALNIVEKDCGHRSVAVPMSGDNTGVDVDRLEEAVKSEYGMRPKELPQGKFWAMFYTIPTFHNPTGAILSPDKSSKLVDLARKYDFVVVCDDVYNLLHYGENSVSPKRLYAYDNPSHPAYKGNVVSNGTFSKILGPGYRVGWLEVPPRLRFSFFDSGILDSGGSMNNVIAGVVASALELGLQQKHLRYLRKLYDARMSAIFDEFSASLPAGFVSFRPGGGYFVWVTGPAGFDSDKFSVWALKERRVQVLPSSKCGSVDGKPVNNAFRISLAFYEEPRLRKATQNLCDALKKFPYDM